MNHDPSDSWLIVYDIREPKRLRRIHRVMTQQGTALQYSVFLVTGVESSVRELLAQLEALMDTRVDDVRAYRLPHDLKVWKLGRQSFPDGVVLAGSDAVRSLLQVDDQLAMGIPLVEEDTTCNIDD